MKKNKVNRVSVSMTVTTESGKMLEIYAKTTGLAQERYGSVHVEKVQVKVGQNLYWVQLKDLSEISQGAVLC